MWGGHGTSEEAQVSEAGNLDQDGSRYFRKGALMEKSPEEPARCIYLEAERKGGGRQQIPLLELVSFIHLFIQGTH